MGIGVNTGSVVVGNIGSERRTKYSVVGSDVNFASRMEAFALAGQILISAATYSRVRDLVEVDNVLEAEMKGLPGRATLYASGASARLTLSGSRTSRRSFKSCRTGSGSGSIASRTRSSLTPPARPGSRTCVIPPPR